MYGMRRGAGRWSWEVVIVGARVDSLDDGRGFNEED